MMRYVFWAAQTPQRSLPLAGPVVPASAGGWRRLCLRPSGTAQPCRRRGTLRPWPGLVCGLHHRPWMGTVAPARSGSARWPWAAGPLVEPLGSQKVRWFAGGAMPVLVRHAHAGDKRPGKVPTACGRYRLLDGERPMVCSPSSATVGSVGSCPALRCDACRRWSRWPRAAGCGLSTPTP